MIRNDVNRNHVGQSLRFRRGTAPLEFAMFLPVFVGFVLAMLVIFQVHSGRLASQIGSTVELARHRSLQSTAEQELGRWPASESQLIQGMLRAFDSEDQWNRGILRAEATAPTSDGFRFFKSQADAAHVQQELGDNWSQHLRFARNANEQKRLALPEQITFYDEYFDRFDAFQTLADVDDGGASAEGQSDFYERYQQAQGAARQAAQDIARKLEELADVIDREKRQPAPDWGRIRQLESERRRLQHILRRLKSISEQF